MYAIFVISNRTIAITQIINIMLLFMVYVLQVIRREKEEDGEEEMVSRIVVAQWILACLIVLIMIYGHIMFVGKKRLEFGTDFNYLALYRGTKCRNDDVREYSWAESLKAFFGGAATKAPPIMQPLSTTPFQEPSGSYFDTGSGMTSTPDSYGSEISY